MFAIHRTKAHFLFLSTVGNPNVINEVCIIRTINIETQRNNSMLDCLAAQMGGVVVCLLILQFFYCAQFFQPSVIEINHLAGCIVD